MNDTEILIEVELSTGETFITSHQERSLFDFTYMEGGKLWLQFGDRAVNRDHIIQVKVVAPANFGGEQ